MSRTKLEEPSARACITMPPDIMRMCDAYAKAQGLSLSGLFRKFAVDHFRAMSRMINDDELVAKARKVMKQ